VNAGILSTGVGNLTAGKVAQCHRLLEEALRSVLAQPSSQVPPAPEAPPATSSTSTSTAPGDFADQNQGLGTPKAPAPKAAPKPKVAPKAKATPTPTPAPAGVDRWYVVWTPTGAAGVFFAPWGRIRAAYPSVAGKRAESYDGAVAWLTAHGKTLAASRPVRYLQDL